MLPKLYSSRNGLSPGVWAALLTCYLCLSVVMQMLGMTVTFSELDDPVEFDNPSLLEEFAIPVDRLVIGRSQIVWRNGGGMSKLYSVLRDHSLFHPPTVPPTLFVG